MYVVCLHVCVCTHKFVYAMTSTWRSEDYLGFWFSSSPCLRKALCCAHFAAGPAASKDSPVSNSHLIVEALGLETCATVSGFTWVLENQTQALKLVWQALDPLNHLLIFVFVLVLRKSCVYPWMSSYLRMIQLLTLLPSPSGWWDHRHVPLCLTIIDVFSDFKVTQVFSPTKDHTLFHFLLLSYLSIYGIHISLHQWGSIAKWCHLVMHCGVVSPKVMKKVSIHLYAVITRTSIFKIWKNEAIYGITFFVCKVSWPPGHC